MIRNYLLTALRNIIRHKSFSILNIVGLSLSMAVCMLIIIVVRDQYSYDRFHKKKDRIYRVESIDKFGKLNLNYASTAFPLAGELKNNYGFVEEAAIFIKPFSGEGVSRETRINIDGLYANSAVFKVFDFPLKWGNTDKILDEPYTIVLQEEEAQKFFGNDNPVGRNLQIDSSGNFRITGVIRKTGHKSHIHFEALVSAGTLESYERSRKKELTADNWNNIQTSYVYLLLKKNTDLQNVQKILDKISNEKYTQKDKMYATFYLQPLTKIVPGPLLANEIGTFLFKPFVLFLIGLALIVIMLAAFNYTSLSIARSLMRAREVGIRKTLGANRNQVIIQFLLEAILISLFALVIAIALLQYLLPGFTGMNMMTEFKIKPSQNLTVYFWFFIFALFTGIISGILPAIFISAFNPQKVLKGIMNIRLFSRITLRKILLVTQFAFSMIFIISIILVFRQLNYMINAQMGFDREVVFNISLNGQNFERVKSQYSQIPEVISISGASHYPGIGNIWPVQYRVKKEDEKVDGDYFSVDASYLSTMGIKLIAGRNFPENMNTKPEKFIIVNEKALNKFKLGTPAEAIGKSMILGDSTLVEIIGVVEDYKYAALFLNLRPMALRINPEKYRWIVLRLDSRNMVATVNKLKTEWKKIDKIHPMEGDFLDAQIRQYYTFFEDVLDTVGFTSLLVIVIASLGLLGMATYSIQTKIKEIAVRKVQGAQPPGIVWFISRSYLWLLLIAAVIAMPIAYLGNNIWFRFMAFHVSFGIGTLISGVIIVMLVGMLTIASQTFKAARTNAAEILKYE